MFIINIVKKIIWLVFLSILLLGIPKISGLIASLFTYKTIDPDGAYVWISIHHIIQSIIFIIIIIVINKFKEIDYGFSWGNKKEGKKYVALFMKFFTIYTIGAYTSLILTNSFEKFSYPLTINNILGQLSFQLFLSGPSEEFIFRGFAITMISILVKGRIFKNRISWANIIAALVFGLAHVGFSFFPLQINYSLFQVIYAIVLGLFYGDCYEKTNSLIYPMIMHSFTNVLMVGSTIILSIII